MFDCLRNQTTSPAESRLSHPRASTSCRASTSMARTKDCQPSHNRGILDWAVQPPFESRLFASFRLTWRSRSIPDQLKSAAELLGFDPFNAYLEADRSAYLEIPFCSELTIVSRRITRVQSVQRLLRGPFSLLGDPVLSQANSSRQWNY